MGRSALPSILFGLTTFVGAFLLFQVQPLIGKYILPWFGGTPAVWTTCMLFFQVMLLAGYAYAHAIIRLLSFRNQVIVHCCLLALAGAVLPIAPNERWIPTDVSDPTLRILSLLTISLGLPYLALSATAPLTQAWFSRTKPGASPYRLYALSNAASLLALLSYPLVFEPLITRSFQTKLWSGMFVAFALICVATAIISVRETKIAKSQPKTPEKEKHNKLAKLKIALWLVLPMSGSVMLLAITNKICQDVAVVPLLWVVPLAIYLCTFIICFDNPKWYTRRTWIAMMAISITAAAWVLVQQSQVVGVVLQTLVYCIALFACCMVYHGELVRLRPEPSQLTFFYLMVAAGGAMGGIFVALVAPIVFNSYFELYLAMFVSVGAAAFLLWHTSEKRSRKGLVGVVAGVLAMMLALWLSSYLDEQSLVTRTRNFFGVISVMDRPQIGTVPPYRVLIHGNVLHGMQFLAPERQSQPTSYYGPDSGIGIAFRYLPRTDSGLRVAAVGLGTGTIAVYAKEGDVFRFYEINPQIERLAMEQFTFLKQSHAKVEVVLGDARMSLQREQPQNFDLLILDAFSGDAIPVHLLTKECFDIYLKHLRSGGVIAVHVSNKYLDLVPVVEKLAMNFGMGVAQIESLGSEEAGIALSNWVLVSRDTNWIASDEIKRLTSRPTPESNSIRLWTDDDTNLLQIMF